MNFLTNFKFDFWIWWGLAAQGLFMLRFLVQWYLSEKAGKVVMPKIFWVISLVGGIMIVVYAVIKEDIVFLVAGILQILLYSRNMFLDKNKQLITP